VHLVHDLVEMSARDRTDFGGHYFLINVKRLALHGRGRSRSASRQRRGCEECGRDH
jgi:hypothetical protein